MIVNSGLTLMRGFLNGEVLEPPSHIAVGTGTTAAAVGDTALETETIRSFMTATKQSAVGVTYYTMTVPSTEGNGTSLSEVGVLNAASGGDLLSRQVHAGYSKTDNFSVKYKITHTLSDV